MSRNVDHQSHSTHPSNNNNSNNNPSRGGGEMVQPPGHPPLFIVEATTFFWIYITHAQYCRRWRCREYCLPSLFEGIGFLRNSNTRMPKGPFWYCLFKIVNLVSSVLTVFQFAHNQCLKNSRLPITREICIVFNLFHSITDRSPSNIRGLYLKKAIRVILMIVISLEGFFSLWQLLNYVKSNYRRYFFSLTRIICHFLGFLLVTFWKVFILFFWTEHSPIAISDFLT